MNELGEYLGHLIYDHANKGLVQLKDINQREVVSPWGKVRQGRTSSKSSLVFSIFVYGFHKEVAANI